MAWVLDVQNGVRWCNKLVLAVLHGGKPTVSRLLEIDIGISKGSAGDHVSAYSDGQNGPSRAEFLVEHGLGNVWMQVSHIEWSHRVARRAGIHVWRRVFSGNKTNCMVVITPNFADNCQSISASYVDWLFMSASSAASQKLRAHTLLAVLTVSNVG